MPLKNKRPDYWFYLEPTVHLLVNTTGSVLFYQSLTKKILEFHDEPVIHAIALQFSKPRAGYVIPLFRSDLEKKEVKILIDALKKNFMGDILDTRFST
ncbi:MAG: hypothetical protein JW731_06830, partial [Bacteroidales bacterium]|nr:hypothetical protein [Bacteroidales bacterium]